MQRPISHTPIGRLLTIIASPRRLMASRRNAFQSPDMTGETPTEDRTRRIVAADLVESNFNVREPRPAARENVNESAGRSALFNGIAVPSRSDHERKAVNPGEMLAGGVIRLTAQELKS
jgi:hypothetical protein